MNIKFKKIASQYAFDIIDDRFNIIYSSNVHSFLTPYIKPTYKYAWEACRDSRQMIFKYPHHLIANRDDMTSPVIVDISTEQMLVNHYMDVYEGLKERAQGSINDPKERDIAYKSIKIVEGELAKILETLKNDGDKKPLRVIFSRIKKLLRKYFKREENEHEKNKQEVSVGTSISFIKKANKDIDDDLRKNVIEDYAQKICQAIQDKHSDCYYSLSLSKIKIMDENDTCILEASVNNDLNIKGIIPCGSLRKIYAFNSSLFYQKYWKPIVEAIGHLVIESPRVLIIANPDTFPDVPKNRNDFAISGWNIDDKKEEPLEISFTKDSWFIRQAKTKTASQIPSKYTEQDYQNAIVKCIDPALDSIYDRTGIVMQVIPHTDIVEIDVNFGRGLGIIRLIEKQIEIISN